MSESALNDAFSHILHTLSWEHIQPAHINDKMRLPFCKVVTHFVQSSDCEVGRTFVGGSSLSCIRVTCHHIVDITVIDDTVSIVAWKFVRKLLTYISNDELGQLSAFMNPDKLSALVKKLVHICFRSCGLCQVVQQPLHQLLIDALDIFEAAVSVLFILKQYTDIKLLPFDIRMVTFIGEYKRRTYICVPVRFTNDADRTVFAYEGTILALYL